MRRRPDTELIVLARQGSQEAAEVLFDRYWTHAWRTAYAVTADRTLADDARIVQESEAGSLPQVVGDLIGTGPTIDREHEGRRRALMPWITLAAVFPLGFILFRRNA